MQPEAEQQCTQKTNHIHQKGMDSLKKRLEKAKENLVVYEEVIQEGDNVKNLQCQSIRLQYPSPSSEAGWAPAACREGRGQAWAWMEGKCMNPGSQTEAVGVKRGI